MDALIGATGYVGQTLLRQRAFEQQFNSKTIADIRGGDFGLMVCAGAPAQKWIADGNPEADLANLKALADHLAAAKAERVILISTVDVFPDSRGKDEGSEIDESRLTPYGANRLWLERFVAERFEHTLVVRLPGLVGPRLRKNAVFDFRNDNNLHMIDHRAVYQFYPMVNLWADLQVAMDAGLSLVHLTAEPVSIGEVAQGGFGLDFTNVVEGRTPASYDFRTRHADLFGGAAPYQYDKRASLTAVRAYAQSEPRSKPLA
jgi:nucleoside-diphosphate-sugar epimerase